MKIKPASVHKIENKNRYNSASGHYNMIMLDESKDVMFFTDTDLIRAIRRAKKNKEDIPEYTISEGYEPAKVGACLFGVGVVSFVLGVILGNLDLF